MEAVTRAIAELRSLFPAAPSHSLVQVIAGFVIGTVLLGLCFYVLERLFPEQDHQPAIHPETRVNAAYWVFDFAIGKRVVTAITVVVLIAILAFRIPRLSWMANQPAWLQIVLVFLVADFFGYWSHRLMHTVPWLWRIHRVHHSSEHVDWLAAGRVHPIESVWTRLVMIVPLFLLGFSPTVTAAFAPVLSIYPIFLHCNVRWRYGWLGYLVASPAFHRWHHSSDAEAINKNFCGLLPIFDFLFGTAYFPRNRRPLHYGLVNEPAPATFRQQLSWPFRGR